MKGYQDEKARRQNVRRVLWQWGDTMRRCERKLEEIDALKRMIDDARGIGARTMDGMPRAGTSASPTERTAIHIENIVESFEEAIEIIRDDIAKATGMKLCIDDLVEMLSPDQQRVIEMRYIEGKSWMVIGFKMNMDESHVKYIERGAITWIIKYVEVNQVPPFSLFFCATM